MSTSWPGCWDHLFRHLERVRWYQAGYWTALCPAHRDATPSLSLRVVGGKLRFYCHAQHCTQEAILEAISARAGVGFTYEDLHADNASHCGRRPVRRGTTAMRITATYDYHGRDGSLLYQAVRIDNAADGRPKDFRYRRPDPDCPGAWLWGLGEVPRVLYRLPELLALSAQAGELPPERRPWVLLLEGEKDCETARRLGVRATTPPCGAAKWHMVDVTPLEGMRLCLVPDVDAPDPKTWRRPGLEHSLQALNILNGHAAEVRMLRLPVQEGQDFTDWAEALPASLGPEGKRRALGRLVASAPAWGPWGPLVRPRDPFLDAVADVAERLWREEYRIHTPAELDGTINVQIYAFGQELAGAHRAGHKPDASVLLSRLVRMGAEILRGVSDLRLEELARRARNDEARP